MDREAVSKFIEQLQQNPQGRVIATNMLESCNEGLISPYLLIRFLEECVTVHRRGRLSPLKTITFVSVGLGPKGISYLRSCRQSALAAEGTLKFTNVMLAADVLTYLVDENYKAGPNLIIQALPYRTDGSEAGAEEFRAALDIILRDARWHSPSATLGVPLPNQANCWITRDDILAGSEYEPGHGQQATRIRDKLGLISAGEGAALLALTFPAADAATVNDVEFARPMFSDLGNERFRVHQPSARAGSLAQEGWGATVNLATVGSRTEADTAGASERVSTALPLSALVGLTVNFLGCVTNTRGMILNKDDDDSFAKEVEMSRTPTEIRESILDFVSQII